MLTDNIKLRILKQGHPGLSVRVLISVHATLSGTEEKIHAWSRRRNSWEKSGTASALMPEGTPGTMGS